MSISEYRRVQLEQQKLERKLDEIALRKAREREEQRHKEGTKVYKIGAKELNQIGNRRFRRD